MTATFTDAQITAGAFTTVNGVAAGATETAVINVASGATLSIAGAAATNVTLVMNGADGNESLTGDADGPTTINGNAGNDTLVGGTAADTLSGGDGADTFTIGATDSLNTALDTISDYTAGTDKLGLAVTPAGTFGTAAAGAAGASVAADVAATGTTSGTLATDIATAVAAQIVAGAGFWDWAGDTIIVKLTGASVAGTNVTYVVQNQVNDTTYDAAADTVVALIGTSTGPAALTDFV
ncbi:MAG: hypothetical protein A3H91_12260 [Gammaproteobacteria bacterium RIFCSPLOWO2_02_FULL_61_13]|nr:MAG: hypothetical protein A3H91_12260 [Gammaproteobacteria bacterium RIFCSPLOWO2_02_FULL_61_13]